MRPSYSELTSGASRVNGSAWGLWGDDDEIGALNDVTPAHVAAAAALVQRGAVFSLNWDLELPSPGLFSRGPLRYVLRDDGFGMDDHYDNLFPQCSSQWDALSHFSHPEHGYYGGRGPAELKRPLCKNGIHNLARRGIASRFVLADVARCREADRRPIDHAAGEALPITEVEAALAAQGTAAAPGDILLIRFGWTSWYESLGQGHRDALAEGRDFLAAGLEPGEATVRWLWDSGIVAVASDNPALEACPFDPVGRNLHSHLIALLGIPIGEMWDLSALAADCANDGRYTGLLTAAPLNVRGGVGSTANALALK
jgi:kynurenine formamidase